MRVANFLGDDYKILSNDLEMLVDSIVYSSRKENNMALITAVLAMTSNPAYQAALITALKTSGRFDSVKKEMQNPSFTIMDYPSTVSNTPAEFTSDYHETAEFVDNVTEQPFPDEAIAFNIKTLVVKRGSTIIARIVTKA